MSDYVETLVMGDCMDHLIVLGSWDDGELFMTLWSPVSTKEWGRWRWMWQSLRGRWNGNNELALDREGTEKLFNALGDHLDRTKS